MTSLLITFTYLTCITMCFFHLPTVLCRDVNIPIQYEIADEILKNYKPDLIPRRHHNMTIQVEMSMQLYQIIEVNEPQQYIMINAWVIERWVDRMLDWDPERFENISEIMLPHFKIWIPDTTLYNSLTMDQGETKRLMNAKLTSQDGQGTMVKLLYPTIYKLSCNLDLRFFPFDVQVCTLIFGSWTFDNTYIDYNPRKLWMGTTNFLSNEEWKVLGTRAEREEVKYSCCPNNYTLLRYYLHLQRKPLYYVINLIIPTSIITLISIVGFFSSSSINDVREEKITLGITTLLSMSILILMVSDKMPSTSSFIPLIGWFYTFMIMLISFATLAGSTVIYVQKQGLAGHRPNINSMRWARRIGRLIRMELPLVMKQAYAAKAREEKLQNGYARKQSIWQKLTSNISRSEQEDTADHYEVPSQKVNASRTSNAPSRQSPSTSINESLLIDHKILLIEDSMTTSCPPYINMMGPDNSPRKRYSQVSFTRPPSLKLIRDDETAGVPVIETVSSRTERRNLAQLEFDWLAAVVERMCLIVFLFLFMIMCFGINGIGVFNWYHATINTGFVTDTE